MYSYGVLSPIESLADERQVQSRHQIYQKKKLLIPTINMDCSYISEERGGEKANSWKHL